MSKRNYKKTPISRAERSTTRNTLGSAAEVSKISEARPRRDRQTKDGTKSSVGGEPVEHIQHIAGNMAKFGDAPREACGSAQDLV